jgi:protein-S-isoprenylcysteine O-methyltransferase Ste14
VFSQDAPEFLWTRGPFAYVRNPFYSSYLLAGLSVALMFFDYSTLVCQGLLLASARAAARGEERKFLLSRLAGEYRAYASRTGRFLPRVGRLRSL